MPTTMRKSSVNETIMTSGKALSPGEEFARDWIVIAAIGMPYAKARVR